MEVGYTHSKLGHALSEIFECWVVAFNPIPDGALVTGRESVNDDVLEGETHQKPRK